MVESKKPKKVFTGCWNCKKGRRRCDETRPGCTKCATLGIVCEGYGKKRIVFDIENGKGANWVKYKGGRISVGFRGRPKGVDRPREHISQSNWLLEPRTTVFDRSKYNKGRTKMHEEAILKHFYNTFSFLIDQEPVDSWYEFALRYCPYESLKNSFCCVALVHLSHTERNSDLYQQALHLRSVMLASLTDSLPALLDSTHTFLGPNESSWFLDQIESHLQAQPVNALQQSILVMTYAYVLLLFDIFDDGVTRLCPLLMSVFCKLALGVGQNAEVDKAGLKLLEYQVYYSDIVTAVSSRSSHHPFSPAQYALSPEDKLISLKAVGCPVEILECLHEIAHLKYLKRHYTAHTPRREALSESYSRLRAKALNYRLYLPLDITKLSAGTTMNIDTESLYILRLKIAQVWALATLIEATEVYEVADSSQKIAHLSCELICILRTLKFHTALEMQMMWPVYLAGKHSLTQKNQQFILQLFATYSDMYNAGNVFVVKGVLEKFYATDSNDIDEVWASVLPSDASYEFLFL